MSEEVRVNRAFEEMKKATLQQLQGKDPLEISKNTGFDFDSERKEFKITTLINKFIVEYPSFQFSVELEGWYHLLVLHYLNQADGTVATGELVSLGSLKDGLIRGTKFERHMEEVLSVRFHGKSEEDIWHAFEKLRGRKREGKGDLSIELSFFPNYPIYFNIWLEDDEFPASVKMLVDKSADHYLTIEDAVTLGDIILRKLQL